VCESTAGHRRTCATNGRATTLQLARSIGSYTPLVGFKLVDADGGDAILKVYAYARYLNQLALDDQHVDAFNDTINYLRINAC